jgi:hypothetical protein
MTADCAKDNVYNDVSTVSVDANAWLEETVHGHTQVTPANPVRSWAWPTGWPDHGTWDQ